jgi:large subunit ribosomal protein L31
MKAEIHPNYREVVFQDLNADFAFLTRSTINTKDTIKWEDGNEYPLVKVETSSHSHPFYTGKQSLNKSAGQVDKFNQRYGRKK